MRLFDPSAPSPESPPTVASAVRLYLPQLPRRVCADEGQERGRLLALFVAELGALIVEDCKPAHLADWLDTHPEWRSDWTRKRCAGTVLACFNWLARMGHVHRNPFVGVELPAGERGRPMEAKHFADLLRRSKPVFRRVLIFLRFTGCRPGELSALEWEHIDPERRVAVLLRHKTFRKTRIPRTIVLNHVAMRLLLWIARHEGTEGPVFRNTQGRPWTRWNLANRSKRLRRACGLPAHCRLYGLRHGFATQAIKAGVDIATLAQLMGHTSTRMTEHYLHLAGEVDHLRAAADMIFGRKK